MPTISIFKFEKIGEINEICKILNGKRFNKYWFTVKPSKYSNKEVFINYWYYEDVEEGLKKVFSEDAHEIVSFLKENGKTKILRRIFCFINLSTKTLEVYRGPDEKTDEIISLLEKLLNTNFTPLKLKSEELQKICSNYSLELKQAIFKNINGLIYEILRGNCLENNFKFKEYLQKFPECLRIISFRPKIKFLNSSNKYRVTVNADRGTIKISEGVFNWRPRFEIRQIIFFLASISS